MCFIPSTEDLGQRQRSPIENIKYGYTLVSLRHLFKEVIVNPIHNSSLVVLDGNAGMGNFQTSQVLLQGDCHAQCCQLETV